MDLSKLRVMAEAILALLIPSHAAVVKFILANVSDDILSDETLAEEFIASALSRRTVSAESITAAETFINPILTSQALVTMGIMAAGDWNATAEAAKVTEIQAAIAAARTTIPTDSAKKIDGRRVFAEAFDIHVNARGAISANLTKLFGEFCPNGPLTDYSGLDRNAIRTRAQALGLPVITRI